MTDNDELRFEWDGRKAASNFTKHGVRFETAAEVFNDPYRLEEDDRFAQGEYRTIIIGHAQASILAVVYTESNQNLIRIISARRATPVERRTYDHNRLHP